MNNWTLDIPSTYLLAALAAVFAHACFQLSVSVLTLLSSHVIGGAKSHARLLVLCASYLLGVLGSTLGLVLIVTKILESISFDIATLERILASLSIAVGALVAAFYYRKKKGTTLWVPRPLAEYLSVRTKKTRSGIEAFLLGIMTVLAELPFTLVPLVVFAFLIQQTSGLTQLGVSAGYTILACLPLMIISGLITSGHKISTIQKWREANKSFLQWSSGITLILLGLYMFVLQLNPGVSA